MLGRRIEEMRALMDREFERDLNSLDAPWYAQMKMIQEHIEWIYNARIKTKVREPLAPDAQVPA